MPTPWVLAVDLGTSGLKVGAVAETGEILATAHRDVVTRFLPEGGIEQDPQDWWDGIVDGVRGFLSAGLVEPDQLAAVGITGQYGSTVPVGADGQPVAPCLIWGDTRGRRWAEKAFGGPLFGYKPSVVASWPRYTGGAPSPTGDLPTGHALFLRYGRPAVHQATAVLLEPIDFLGLRLTGRAAASPASSYLSWLVDTRPDAPLRYVPSLVKMARRDPSKLPELVPSCSVLGQLREDAAHELGLPPGRPVMAPVADLHAAFAASGAVADRQAHLSIGTTSWISCAVPFKKTDILHTILSIPGVRPGQYLVMSNQDTAGLALQWVRDGVFRAGDGFGPDWRPSYDDLVGLAGQAPPGSGGVIFTPWLKGEHSPVDNRDLRGSFLNLSLQTDRSRLVRAILEGVAYNLRWLLGPTEKFVGQRLDGLRAVGGGSRSTLWLQILANVTGRRIEQVDDPGHALLRGTALLSLVATGRLRLEDVPDRIPVAQTFTPDPTAQAVYEPLYQEFTAVAGSLKGMYHRLNG